MIGEPKDVLELARALGIGLYRWQMKIVLTIEQAATMVRKKLAVRAPNGAGKTARIVALSALRWLQRFPTGRVVITSFSMRQVTEQLWPALMAQSAKFPGWNFITHEKVVATPTGGRLRAFSTDDPGAVEGFHADRQSPLLIIVDEAKSVAPEIIQAIDRCSYNVLVYISSPGLMIGPFFEAFRDKAFVSFAAGLQDCPHKPKEQIDDIIAKYGENDPFVRSTVYGEFMATAEGIAHALELPDALSNQNAKIDKIHGELLAGVDFAAGRAQNVLCARNGNHVPQGWLRAWREKDTYAAVGRFIMFFTELNLKANMIWADADGVGLPMVNHLEKSGWRVNRFHGNGKSPHLRCQNLISYAWNETCSMVRNHKIVLPHDEQLVRELTTRRLEWRPDGKLKLEDKEALAARGVPSPDLADAFCMAFACQPVRNLNWAGLQDQESRYADISKAHGWSYNEDPEKSPTDLSAFGVHSEW